jgi:hypothetical protein
MPITGPLKKRPGKPAATDAIADGNAYPVTGSSFRQGGYRAASLGGGLSATGVVRADPA